MSCGGVDFTLGVDVKGVVRAAKGGGAEGVCSEGGIGGRGGKAGGGGGNEEWKCPKVGDGTGGVAEAGRRAKAFRGFSRTRAARTSAGYSAGSKSAERV